MLPLGSGKAFRMMLAYRPWTNLDGSSHYLL
jgi:hypothetical protein